MLKKIFKIFIVITAIIVLAACKKNESVDKDNENEGSSAIENMLNITFDKKNYDLSSSFSKIVTDAADNGHYVGSSKQPYLYNMDGSFSEKRYQDIADFDASKAFTVERKVLDDGFISTGFVFENNNLQKFVTADGIKWSTSIKKIPDYYISLGETATSPSTSFDTFALLLKDGKLWDIQSYIDQLPETASSELLEEVTDSLSALQPTSFYSPMMFRFSWKDTFKDKYDSNPENRKNVALLKALVDAQESVRNGENDNMAVLYIIYKEKQVYSFQYTIFSKDDVQ